MMTRISGSICRTRLIAGLFLAALPMVAAAQATDSLSRDSVKVALIRQLLTQAHATDQMIAAMEMSLPAQRAANPRVPAVFWDRFMAQVHARRGELEDMMVAVYDRHFSTDEMRQLLAFYQTPIGRKVLEVQPTLMQESIVAGQQWGARIGVEVGRQLAAEGVKMEP